MEGGGGKTIGQFEGYTGVPSKSLSLIYTMAREENLITTVDPVNAQNLLRKK